MAFREKNLVDITPYKRWSVEHSGCVNYFPDLLIKPRTVRNLWMIDSVYLTTLITEVDKVPKSTASKRLNREDWIRWAQEKQQEQTHYYAVAAILDNYCPKTSIVNTWGQDR